MQSKNILSAFKRHLFLRNIIDRGFTEEQTGKTLGLLHAQIGHNCIPKIAALPLYTVYNVKKIINKGNAIEVNER